MNPPDPRDSTSLNPTSRPVAGTDRSGALRGQVRTDAVSRDLWALIRREADRVVAAAPVVYKHDAAGYLLFPIRLVQGRILASAFAFRITGEAKYLDAARRELLALAALPDWCPAHFLDVGEAALASGIGLRWLGDALPADERDRIARAIVENALKPSLDVPDVPNSWLKGDFNWNPVCHAGLTVGALAVADREPALSKRIVDRAIECVPYAGATYAPDGATPEGPSYWAYGTIFYVILVEALRASRGDDAGLAALPGFLKTADFIVQMRGATGEDFNYADYHERHPPSPVTLWFARELRRPDLAAPEIADLRRLAAAAALPESDGSRHLPFELLWWDPTLPSAPAAAPPPTAWVAGGQHVGLAAFRTAWNDPRATYFAIKGGTPDGSHAHMDVGGFVLESDGVRWAIDLGTEDYDRMRAAGIELWNYGQDGSRWTVFRCGPEAHNILRFDDGRQTSAGFAPVARVDGRNAAIVDLTSIYAGAATSVTRRAELNADRSVTIADAWAAGPRDVAVAWQWLTHADATVVAGGVVLRQAGESLTLRIASPLPFDVRIEDVSAPRGPQDSPNPGVRRIVVSTRTPAHGDGALTVRATPGAS